MKQPISVLAGALILAAAASAQAVVIYDNGAPNQQNGNEMTEWIQSEDFTFAADTTVTDVHFWSAEAANAFSGSIVYTIYADNGGNPGAALETGTGDNLVRTGTGLNVPPGNTSLSEFFYSFDITPFLALGGTTYHLGLHNGPDTNSTRVEMYWETTDPNTTAFGREFDLTTGGPWISNEQEHAFQLTGGGAAVPEPATLALVGLGLAAFGIGRRGKQN